MSDMGVDAVAAPAADGAVQEAGIPQGESADADGLSEDAALQEAIKAANDVLKQGGDDQDSEIPLPGKPRATDDALKATDDVKKTVDELSAAVAKRKAEAKEKLRLREEFREHQVKLEQEKQHLERQKGELLQAVEYVKMLKTDPAEAVRALGFEPEDFIARLAEAGSPEHKRKSELDEYRNELRELRRQIDSQNEERARLQQEQQRMSAIQHRQDAENRFLNVALKEEFPTLSSLFSGRESKFLLEVAHDTAEEYYQATGKVADFRDIAQYLEEQYSSRVGKGMPTKGKPPQGKRGAVTLSSISSERSTGFEPSEDDDDDEALRKAIAASKLEFKRASEG